MILQPHGQHKSYFFLQKGSSGRRTTLPSSTQPHGKFCNCSSPSMFLLATQIPTSQGHTPLKRSWEKSSLQKCPRQSDYRGSPRGTSDTNPIFKEASCR